MRNKEIENNICTKIQDKVKDVILKEKLIQDKDNIVVAVSGGPDSMCLLDILNSLKKEFSEKYNINYTLIVAHVNHMIREESNDEKVYVENFCQQKEISFYYLKENVPKLSKELKMSEETCGRYIRYKFFEEVRIKTNSQKIVVAHNLDDNIETILLNMIRGCGLKGLIGMDYSYEYLIRPLLDIEKKDILEYNTLKKLNPCFDKTNEQDIYIRNKVRLKLIPELKDEYNQNIVQNITRMKKILQQDENFLEEYTQKVINLCIMENNSNIIKFNFSNILTEHESIKSRAIREILKLKMSNLEGLENIHILDILKILQNNIKGKKFIMGKKFILEIIAKNIAIIY